MLTAEGKLFLEEVRELLKHADESVEKVRALARGEYGELHLGYAPVPTTEILPRALAAFQKAVPRVKVLLHDLSSDELIAGLRNATLELSIMIQPTDERTVASRLKSIPFEKLAAEAVVGLSRRLPRVISLSRVSFPPYPSQTADRGGMRQREFADHGSGVRRDRASDLGHQARGWQMPALSPADRQPRTRRRPLVSPAPQRVT